MLFIRATESRLGHPVHGTGGRAQGLTHESNSLTWADIHSPLFIRGQHLARLTRLALQSIDQASLELEILLPQPLEELRFLAQFEGLSKAS